MSLTVQQLVSDAKKLAGRLKEREIVADALLNETHAINKKIDAMKQVRSLIFEPNSTCESSLVSSRMKLKF